MSIDYLKGNIFTSSAEVLVNPVNCMGIMGAGLALEFRLRYPEMFTKYIEICEKKQLSPGKLWIYNGKDKRILNFPTKSDWKDKTKKEYLIKGFEKFIATYEEKLITSIAFPLLGSDKGGLNPNDSLEIMTSFLQNLNIKIEIYEYTCDSPDEIFDDIKKIFMTTSLDIISNQTRIKKHIIENIYQAISSKPFYQVNQLLSIDGVGIASIEKIFSFYKDAKKNTQQPLF